MLDIDPTLVVVCIAVACITVIGIFALIYPSED
jgi:preprotein translocase subunit Sec61beta